MAACDVNTVPFPHTLSLGARSVTEESTSSTDSASCNSIVTPLDSPCDELIELITSDMTGDQPSATKNGDDDARTPRPSQVHFADVKDIYGSPSKPKSLGRVVGKAKGLVKAIYRKTTRKAQHKEPAGTMTESKSAGILIPGAWRETYNTQDRPDASIRLRNNAHADYILRMATRRMASATSTTGIYSPGSGSPALSLLSLFSNPVSVDIAAEPALTQRPSDSDETVPAPAPIALGPTLARIALFVPWCVAVGATILLFPAHLDRVVFGTGYISAADAPRGVRRFAFWAHMAADYVKIFAVALAVLWALEPRLGAAVCALAAGRFAAVWMWFKPHSCCLHKNVGVDDMESLWLLVQDQAYVADTLEDCCAHHNDPEPESEEEEEDESGIEAWKAAWRAKLGPEMPVIAAPVLVD